MSAMFGIFWRRANSEQSEQKVWVNRVRAAVRAVAKDKTGDEYECGPSLLVKFDFGAFGSSGVNIAEDRTVTAIAGHPCIDALRGRPRAAHLSWLVTRMAEGPSPAMAATRGSFALVQLGGEPAPHLLLATDCLGVRPLYYLIDNEKVIFSSTVALFENLYGSQLALDERGAVERAVFGSSLGDRTQYDNVHCLRPGQILRVTPSVARLERYWHWTDRPGHLEEDAIEHIYETFTDAVALRLDGDQRVMAFLTGGMDSRCVVSALRQRNLEVNTLNFAPARSQDLVFGARIAKALETNHFEVPMLPASWTEQLETVLPQWWSELRKQRHEAEHANLVWSGDGGSLGLGHVYLNDNIVDLAKSQGTDEALKALIRYNYWVVPVRVMQRSKARAYADVLFMGLREELSEIDCDDPGRALHILLMVTQQHHHMHDHYERILQHECEKHLPFYDRLFLESVFRRPVRPFLAHRFYNRWIKCYPPALTSVPWQSYPGHEACPAPFEEELSYQWDPKPQSTTLLRARTASRRLGVAALFGHYRNPLVSQLRLILACAATFTGARDLSYAVDFAESLNRWPPPSVGKV